MEISIGSTPGGQDIQILDRSVESISNIDGVLERRIVLQIPSQSSDVYVSISGDEGYNGTYTIVENGKAYLWLSNYSKDIATGALIHTDSEGNIATIDYEKDGDDITVMGITSTSPTKIGFSEYIWVGDELFHFMKVNDSNNVSASSLSSDRAWFGINQIHSLALVNVMAEGLICSNFTLTVYSSAQGLESTIRNAVIWNSEIGSDFGRFSTIENMELYDSTLTGSNMVNSVQSETLTLYFAGDIEHGSGTYISPGGTAKVNVIEDLNIVVSSNDADFKDYLGIIALSTIESRGGASHLIFDENVTSIRSYSTFNSNIFNDIEDITINSECRIGDYAFGTNGIIRGPGITLPEKVTSVGDYGLRNVTLTDGNLEISGDVGTQALQNVLGLTNLLISGGDSIGSNAFAGCTDLGTVTITSGDLVSISDDAFDSSGYIVELIIDDSLVQKLGTNWITSIFSDQIYYISEDLVLELVLPYTGTDVTLVSVKKAPSDFTIGTISIDGNSYQITSIREDAFRNLHGISRLTISDTVRTIGDYAFAGSTISEVVVSEGASIDWGTGVFQGCSDLALVSGIKETANYMFEGCTSLTSIPEGISSVSNYAFRDSGISGTLDLSGVTSIGNYAFSGCTSLTALVNSDEVKSLGNNAFSGCTSLTSGYFAVNGLIPNYAYRDTGFTSVDVSGLSLGDYAFYECESLESITVNESTVLGSGVFSGCISLSHVNGTMNGLSTGAFNGCTSLTEMPSFTDTSIPSSAFRDSGIKSVDLSGYVSIGDSAFMGCESLETVQGYPLSTFSNNVFRGCSNLTDFSFTTGLSWENVSSIGSYALYETSLNLDDTSLTLSSVGSYALYGLDLGNVVLNDGFVVSANSFVGATIDKLVINSYTFNSGSSTNAPFLGTDIDMLEVNTNNVARYLFYGSNVKEVYLNQTGTTVNSYAFYGCSMLETINFSNVGSINSNAFMGCASLGITWDEPLDLSGFDNIPGSVFQNCTSLKGIIVGEGCSIQNYAFAGCTSLATIYNDDEISVISTGAFQGCSSLTELDLTGTTNIGTWAFEGCNNLDKIIVLDSCNLNPGSFDDISIVVGLHEIDGVGVDSAGNDVSVYCINDGQGSWKIVYGDEGIVNLTLTVNHGITAIGMNAFSNSQSLENVVISTNITQILDGAFRDCPNLKSVMMDVYSGTQSSDLTSLGNNAFSGCTSLSFIGIDGTDNVLPDSITSLGSSRTSSSIFSNCTSLESIVLPSGITSIGGTVFMGCTNLQTVEFLSTITSIGSRAFQNTGITDITLSSSISIGEQAFMGCTSLNTVTFTGTADLSIPNNAFNGCSALTTVNGIENAVTVRNSAFSGTSLTQIVFDKAVTIEQYAFNNCPNLVSVTFNGGATIGNQAFANCETLADVVFNGTSTIGDRAFANCITLGYSSDDESHVLVLNGVTTIESRAFMDCAELSAINLPDTLTSLAVDAFIGCTSVETLTAAGGTFTSENNVIYSDDGRGIAMFLPSSETVNITSGVTSIAGFEEVEGKYVSTETTALSVLQNLTSISVEGGNFLFEGGEGVLKLHDGSIVSVPRQISEDGNLELRDFTSIEQNAFNSVNVISLVLEGSFEVNSNAFVNCDTLSTITVRSGDQDWVYFDLDSLYSDSEAWAVNALTITAGTITITGQTSSVRNVVIKAKSRLDVTGQAFTDSSNKLVSVELYSGGHMSLGDETIVNAGNLESVTIASETIDAGRIMSGCSASVRVYLDSTGLGVDSLDGQMNENGGYNISKYYISTEMSDNGFDTSESITYFGGYIHYDPEYGVLDSVDEEGKIFFQTELEGVHVTLVDDRFTIETADAHAPSDLVVQVNGVDAIFSDGGYSLGDTASVDMVIITILEKEDSDSWYTVRFDTGCSVVVSSMKVSSGHTILDSMLPEPTRPGFVFQGWFIDPGLSVEYKSGSIFDERWIITGDTTLYAKWQSLGDYVDVDDSAGSFYQMDGNGNVTLFEPGSFDGGAITLVFVPRTGYSVIDIDIEGSADITITGGTIVLQNVSGYVRVVPEVKYVSHATDLEFVVEQDTPKPTEDLVLAWYFNGGQVVQTGMAWSGMPSVPLIVDDFVYVQVNDTIVCLDSRTGDVVNQVSTGTSTSDFYHYLGYGGGWILDYTSMNVYTEDLEYVCKIPLGIRYAIWSDGYFYAITGNFDGVTPGVAVRMTPENIGPDGRMVVEAFVNGSVNPMQYLYGTTSSPVLVDEDNATVMYYISTNGSSIYINALNLNDGTYGSRQIEMLTGYYLDDGWLTYYEGHLYITAYSVGLFGTSSVSGNAVIVYFDAAGPEGIGSVELNSVDLGHSSLTSAFVIQNGRGYVNITESGQTSIGYLRVYNIGEDGEPVFEKEVSSRASHGSLVVSTYNYDSTTENGDVYIYLLNYSTSQYLTIFTDTCVDGVWTLSDVAASKPLEPGFGSQAVRVGTEGQLIFYNDSGNIFCYGSSSFTSGFGFVVDKTDSIEVKTGNGVDEDPYAAFENAAAEAFGVRSTSFDRTAGTITVAGDTYNVFYLDNTDGASLLRSVVGLSETSFGSMRSFYLTTMSETDIDLDSKWYGTPGNDHGTESSGELTISDTKLTMRTESVTGSDLPYQYQLGCTTPADSVVRWSSSNTNVAYVDANGFVTARSVGQTVITASITVDGKVTMVSCIVYVTETCTADLIAHPEYFEQPVSSSQTFEIIFDWGVDGEDDVIIYGTIGTIIRTPDNSESDPVQKEGYEFRGWMYGGTIYDGDATFVISNSGTVTAIWLSTTTAVVDATVSVDGTEIQDSSNVHMLIGDSAKLTVTMVPEGSGVVSVSSSNPRVLSYSDGALHGLMAGSVTVNVSVTSSANTITVEFTVDVTAPELEIIADRNTLYVGQSGQLSVYLAGSNVTAGSEYSSSDETVLTIESDGTYTAVAVGTAAITVSHPDGAKATVIITVNGTESIIISGYDQLMEVGSTGRLTATTTPQGIAVTWSSSNPGVISVDSQGNIRAVATGIAVITATAVDGSGMTGTCIIQVDSVKVESVELNRSTLTLTIGGTQTLTATVSPDDAANKTVVWSSSNPLVASVSNAGVVTAVSVGTAVITVTTVDGSHTATCTVTVQGEVTTIVLDRTSLTIAVSETATIGATTTPTENATVTWRSSDSRIVSVDSEGNVKGVSPGTATITVSHGDISATCTVIVYEGSEAVDKGTVDNGDGTQTSTIEEIIEAGDNTIVKTTQTTTGSDGDIVSTEVTMEMTTEGSGTVTVVNIASDPTGNSTASATTTIPSTVTTSNGRQTISVSTSDVIAAAQQISSVEATSGQSVSTTVVIAAPTSGDVIDSSVTISEEAMSELYGSGDAGIRVDTGVGSVELSSDTVSEMAVAGGDVVLAVSQVFESELNDAQRSAVSDGTVFSLSVSAGSTQIHQLGGTATVSLPHSLDGGRAEDVHVYCLDENGTMTEHRCSYDETTGMVTFETDHFSYYVVSNGSLIGSESSDGSSDDGLSVLLYAVIGLLAALIAMFGLNMYLTHIRGRA